MPARVRVPASTSNLGSGFDCMGLALGLWLDASFEPGGRRLEAKRGGQLERLTGEDLFVRTFRSGLEARGIEPAGVLDVTSQIPLSRGLGSSAAAAVAGLSLAAAAAGETIDLDATLSRATEIEGHPDNAAPALLGGLVGVTRAADGRLRPFHLPLSGVLTFAWAAPPVEVSTALARAALPASVEHALAVRALSRTAALIEGLAGADADLLRAGFDDELHVPYRLPLIPGGREAMEAARDAGAIAVTISGSGSGLFAVCRPGIENGVAEAMGATFRDHAADPSDRERVLALAVEPDHTGARVLPP